MEHPAELEDFILKHKYFWWWVPEGALLKLSLNSIVEATLNYGSITEIKQLFELIGIEKVADVFFEATINRPRINYHPEVANFFTLYFKKYVLKYSNRESKQTNPFNQSF
jgi:hypothetical protein